MDKYNLDRYITLQIKKIEEHKYYLSEKEQRDVGFQYALENWTFSEQAKRWNSLYFKKLDELTCLCDDHCNIECCDKSPCYVTKEQLHKILGD